MVIKEIDLKETFVEIDNFLRGLDEEGDWDDFINIKHKNRYINAVKSIVAFIPERFPPAPDEYYCNEQGKEVLRLIRDHFL
jgi:hypothetical protein